jgi:RNA polymerase sigma factor (sigma-70 family)
MSRHDRLIKVIGRRGARVEEIERLYRRRKGAFLVTVTAFLGDSDAALDAVQDGFVLALRKRGSFRGEGDLEAWVWRIVLNAARDRATGHAAQAAVTNFASGHTESRNTASSNEDHSELRELICGLPERQRLAVFLRYYADLSYSQLGQALGVDPGTVGASLNAAHRTLRRELEKQTELEVANERA